MFNDLTDNQNQKTSEVDDIFAETDDIPTPSSGNQIKTRQVGLSSLSEDSINDDNGSLDDDREEQAKTGKFLKIAIIFVIVAILILGGYLVYSKFLSPEKIIEEINPIVDNSSSNNNVAIDDEAEVKVEIDKKDVNEYVDEYVDPIIPEKEETSVGNNLGNENNNLEDLKKMDTDGDKIFDYDEIYVHKTDPKLIDTDADGLSDYDEIFVYSTDPLKADTDGDGLSDYDEVTLHGTDPLKADTDGDGYTDFEELSNGYNPLGEGSL